MHLDALVAEFAECIACVGETGERGGLPGSRGVAQDRSGGRLVPLLASPLARERSSRSVVAEPRPDDVTPKKLQLFDVSTVKDAALKKKEGNGSSGILTR